jgi:ATP-dependent exoDNAse (exonuclease V) alpha subunit
VNNKTALELSEDFQFALDLMEKTKKNLFITGRAGTGKSTLLHLFRNTTRKKVVVLAPTGIAALNVAGQTIHSFFGFPAKLIPQQDIKKRRDRRLYERMEVLIIDEISMVRADLLDNIDYFLRINRSVNEPFGGLQVIFFGDLFQLPPVVTSQEEQIYFRTTYETPFFFSANVLLDLNFEMETLELRRVYRQEARRFVRLLDAVRLNKLDWDDLEELNERHEPDFEGDDLYITLSTRNDIADKLNERKLNDIAAREMVYAAATDGDFDPRQYPTEAQLRLRIGAQVMFIKNDQKREFVNGTIGKVVNLELDKIEVQIEDREGNPKKITVEPFTWNILRYKINENNTQNIETETIGSFKQYPLKLAWAMTIHKSQGKTFDRIMIDLGSGAFEHGQTYVALSRCRTLEGIVLKQKIRPQDVRVDERIIEFYDKYF